MNYFGEALSFTLEQEGGFVDDPRDAGGRTNMGITQRTYSGWLYARGQVAADVADMPRATAGQIYSELYWAPYGLGAITRRAPAIAIFDAGVLFGPDVSAFRAQQALVDCGAVALVRDGKLGVETCRAIESFFPGTFLKAFRDQLALRVDAICASRPENAVFRDGWLNRINRYANLA